MLGSTRKGSVYVSVLGVALIVGVIGISSLHVARLEVRESSALVDMANARLAARSGIECAIARLKADSSWRSNYTSGAANLISNLTGILADDDAFQFAYVDSDGDLDDSDNDAVTIRSVGTAGRARHVLEVLLMPSGLGVDSLDSSLHADELVKLDQGMATYRVSSNGDLQIKSGKTLAVSRDAWAVGDISGTVSPATGRLVNQSPPRVMPDPIDVFEYYMSNGTPISFGELPGGNIDKCVLSAGGNPFGSQVTNRQGIYVVDCQGNKVTVRNCRIRGTLIFANASTVEVEGSIVWEPHVPGFPAMMVEGKINFRWDADVLLSEATHNQNFNPPHTPHTIGSDNDTFDSYTGLIAGLVYATDDLDVSNTSKMKGVLLVGGEAKVTGSLAIEFDSTFYNDAPPGFTAGNDMEIVPGTWTHVAY